MTSSETAAKQRERKVCPMKKLMLFVVTLALMLSVACADQVSGGSAEGLLVDGFRQMMDAMSGGAAAETETEEAGSEIMFRGMPWGTSATDFITAMQSAGVSGSASASRIYSWERLDLPGGTIQYASMKDDRGFEYSAYPDGFMVAGLPVSEIRAYFTYGFDDETVYTTPDQSGLYHAIYSFDGVADRQATADMLYEKMCIVYGETPRMLATKQHNGFTGYVDYAVWEGENDTVVMLMNAYYLEPDGTPYDFYIAHLDLCYGKSNSVELIDAVGEAVAREEREAVTDNLDGL